MGLIFITTGTEDNFHARIQEFSSGGSRSVCLKKSSDNVFFLVHSLFYRSRIQRNISFFKLPEGGPTFSRGGGGSNFFQGGPIAYSLYKTI